MILGLFLFGTARVGEFLDKGFTFISLGNDLHHVLTQSGAYMKDVTSIAKDKSKKWQPRPSALLYPVAPASRRRFPDPRQTTVPFFECPITRAFVGAGFSPPCHPIATNHYR